MQGRSQMTTPPRKAFQFGLGSLFGLMAATGLLCLVAQPPLLGIVAGPLTLSGWWAWGLAAGLGLVMALAPIKQTPWSVVVAIFAATGWLFCGIVGMITSM